VDVLNPVESPPFPKRHGADVDAARRSSRSLRRLLTPDCEPNAEQWNALGASLLLGDAPMDALVEWMSAEGFARAKPLFDRASRHGVDSIENAPEALRTFFSLVERRPAWVDSEQLAAGMRASALAGRMGNYVLRDIALLAGYRASAINRTLVLTGALEKGPQRRLAETTKWWLDCTRPAGMEPFAPGYVSTLQVRLIHALVRRSVARRSDWDASTYGVPINQGDMHVTYLAFSVVYLLGIRLLGVPISNTDAQSVMHLWRYIGWLMGVTEHRLHVTESDGRVALYHNLLAQAPPDETSRQLGSALVDEPLGHYYPNFGWVRGRWTRALHLSIVRAFVGKSGMADLGLPSRVLPWYPLLTFVPRAAIRRVRKALPAGRRRLMSRGLAEQEQCLAQAIGAGAALTYAEHVLEDSGH